MAHHGHLRKDSAFVCVCVRASFGDEPGDIICVLIYLNKCRDAKGSEQWQLEGSCRHSLW